MTIAAYMIHECGHNTVFVRHSDNATLGRIMSWLCGAAYGTYEDMRYKHFRHHVDNDDVVWFEYDDFSRGTRYSLAFSRYSSGSIFPRHDIVMHVVMVFTSFIIPQRRDQRRRNVTVIVIRGGIFLALLVFFPKVALLYVLAYLLMMQALRFMDMLQHDYPYNATLFDYADPPHKGDFEWEQEHTFSNPISLRFEKLNWLTLNFGFSQRASCANECAVVPIAGVAPGNDRRRPVTGHPVRVATEVVSPQSCLAGAQSAAR